jgi:uncharacterized surface protein with fasciclin (FAS1) repeats
MKLLYKKEIMLKLFSVAIMTAFVLAPTAGVHAAKLMSSDAAKPVSATIVDIVLAKDGEFDVLQAAVIETGLADALSGKRQFTIFAPTDDAFRALVASLTKQNIDDVTEEDAKAAVIALEPAFLADVLLYHVMPGRHTSQSVLARDSYRMLSGDRLTIEELDIEATDISARNGVVHVINTVLIPF